MTLLEFFALVIIAGVVGAIGSRVARSPESGCLVSIGSGFIGALVGSWLAELFGLPAVIEVRIGPNLFPVVWALIGAILVVLIRDGIQRLVARRRPLATATRRRRY